MIDYTGMRSGRLVVIGFDHKTKTNHVYVKCKCDCGKECVVRASCIKRGTTKSCGCYAHDRNVEHSTKHNGFGTRLYNIWSGMKRRCYDPRTQAYKFYGLKGITYCKDWENFEPFQKWAFSHGYSDVLSLDRIDNSGDYCPENCRWVTQKEQARNKSNNHVVEYKGEKFCTSELAEKCGINYNTFLGRLRKTTVEEAVNHKKGKLFHPRKMGGQYA